MPQTDTLAEAEFLPIIDGNIFIPTGEIHESYANRLVKMLESDCGPLMGAMGFEIDESGVTVPVSGLADRLREAGVDCQFDMVPISAKVAPPLLYLEMVNEGKGPVGRGHGAYVMHDAIFHGPGFLAGLDKPTGDFVKTVAGHALAVSTDTVVSHAVNEIDTLSGSFTVSRLTPEEDLQKELARSIKSMAKSLLLPVHTLPFGERLKLKRYAEHVLETADDMAANCIKHFEANLELLAAA